jgi:hypothetical protein
MWMIAAGLLMSLFSYGICSEQLGIEIVPEEVAFGNVEKNEIRTEKVMIKNLTDSPVRIEEAKSSSESVSLYFLTGKEIVANGTGILKVAFAGLSLGQHKEQVELIFGQPNGNSASIQVSANVIEPKVKKTPEQATRTQRAAHLEVEPKEHDFGEVFAPKEVTFEIRVRNKGDEELKMKVRAGCGCMKASQLPPLGPGESGTIKVTFDTSERMGKQEEFVSIYGDENTSPITKVRMTGTVKTDYTWEPGVISLGRFSWTGDRTRTLTIKGIEMRDLEVTGIKFTEPRITARLEKSAEEGSTQYKIEITLPKGIFPVGQFKELAKISTNSPHRPELTVPILGEVRGDLSCIPRTAMFKVLKAKKDFEKTIEVQSDSKTKFRVIRLELSDERVIAEKGNEDKSDWKHTIRLRLKGEDIQGFFKAVLKIHTDVKDEPAIEVPIYAYLPQ